MQYKLLALDIDGTLVPEHTNTLSEPLKNAIQKIKNDIIIAIVSARARKDQQVIIDALGLQGRYHVSENGTRIIRPDGELAYTLYLPFAEVQEIKKRTEKLCDSIGYCVAGNWLSAHPTTSQDCVTTLSLIPPKENAEQVVSLIRSLPTPYSLTVANHWSDPKLAVVLVSHKDASKGGGLRALQKILSITPEETIAVGDGASDVPMMEYAAVKVAMGNAEDTVKKVATHIVAPVSEDGVVEVIEKFILKGAMSKTITICSSMQFTSEIRAAQVQLEALGYTVLTPELSEKSVEYLNLPLEAQRAAKRTFIANHFARIAQSDAIVVLNYEKKGVKGYIGSNTLMEIGVAYSLGKKIYLLHPLGEQGCSEEVLALATAVLDGTLKVLEKEAR